MNINRHQSYLVSFLDIGCGYSTMCGLPWDAPLRGLKPGCWFGATSPWWHRPSSCHRARFVPFGIARSLQTESAQLGYRCAARAIRSPTLTIGETRRKNAERAPGRRHRPVLSSWFADWIEGSTQVQSAMKEAEKLAVAQRACLVSQGPS